MKNTDKILRAIAFYTALIVFFTLLPIVLSYTLGYKIDYKALKVYKTGIIYVASHPAGATVYINGKQYNDLTPMKAEELKPGNYNIRVTREGFCPWERDMEVRPNMVVKADRIVLFPVSKEIKMVMTADMADFTVSDNRKIYYLTRYGLLRSDIDGGSMKKLSPYSDWPENISGKKFSPSGDRFLFFGPRGVWVAYLDIEKPVSLGGETAKVENIFTASDPIIDVFWYPEADYIIVVTDKDIRVVESARQIGLSRNTASLYKFNSRPKGIYYDESAGGLYFTDTKAPGSPADQRYLYKLELKEKFFNNLMKILVRNQVDEGYEKR